MQGIEIALRQSRSLNVLGGEAYRAGLRQIETESEGFPRNGSHTDQQKWRRKWLPQGRISVLARSSRHVAIR